MWSSILRILDPYKALMEEKMRKEGEGKMNTKYVHYKEQCDLCINKGKCDYEKRTRKFVETINGVESLSSGVFGSFSFKCDYFDLDQLAYNQKNPPECNG